MYRTVVTGASSGIGRETALLLATERHSLVLVARREALLDDVAKLCQANGAPAVTAVAGDVSSPGVAERAADAAARLPEGELVLVNNAGFASFGPFHEQEVEDAVQTVDVVLAGGMRMARALLPAMVEEGSGTIVNVLSIAATMALPGAAAYCAAKAGMLAFGRALSAEYRKQGVRVTSILPGSTDTPIWDDVPSPPPREDMMPATAVAEAIRDVVHLPRDRAIDELVLMPPKGFL